MRVALAESRRALPACRPNPPVDCALVRARSGAGAVGVHVELGLCASEVEAFLGPYLHDAAPNRS